MAGTPVTDHTQTQTHRQYTADTVVTDHTQTQTHRQYMAATFTVQMSAVNDGVNCNKQHYR